MQIDDSLILRLEHLNRLELSPEERAQIKDDLNRILGMVGKLNELDVDGVEPLVYLSDAVNVLRQDEPGGQSDRADALKNAPDHDDVHFRVAKVIDL
jgi:aspartyl-tRNA(Asn)/glutamyl-tRNA(Gln) amidotransferase subunit C